MGRALGAACVTNAVQLGSILCHGADPAPQERGSNCSESRCHVFLADGMLCDEVLRGGEGAGVAPAKVHKVGWLVAKGGSLMDLHACTASLDFGG